MGTGFGTNLKVRDSKSLNSKQKQHHSPPFATTTKSLPMATTHVLKKRLEDAIKAILREECPYMNSSFVDVAAASGADDVVSKARKG